MEFTKPYKFIGLGAMEVTKPYKIYKVWGTWMSPNRVKVIGFGDIQVPHL